MQLSGEPALVARILEYALSFDVVVVDRANQEKYTLLPKWVRKLFMVMLSLPGGDECLRVIVRACRRQLKSAYIFKERHLFSGEIPLTFEARLVDGVQFYRDNYAVTSHLQRLHPSLRFNKKASTFDITFSLPDIEDIHMHVDDKLYTIIPPGRPYYEHASDWLLSFFVTGVESRHSCIGPRYAHPNDTKAHAGRRKKHRLRKTMEMWTHHNARFFRGVDLSDMFKCYQYSSFPIAYLFTPV